MAGRSSKSISYYKDFKISAVRRYHNGLPPSKIFRQTKFNINIICTQNTETFHPSVVKNIKEEEKYEITTTKERSGIEIK